MAKAKEAEPELGIKETTEILDAAFEVAGFVVRQLKDGLDFEDGLAFYREIVGNAEFRDKLIAAWDNFAIAGDELKDLSVLEGLDIGIVSLTGAKKIVKALQ